MPQEHHLNNPWLVAAWPGMGAVGISAAYYLMAKLGMHLLAEFPAREFFDLEHVDVKNGLIRTGRLPRSRLFLWKDPNENHDLIVFIGEAQPPTKGDAFCRKLIARAREMQIQRVFTFAAMASQMRPEDTPDVYVAAIDQESLAELQQVKTRVLEEGNISGLNGVLLGVASENGMKGGCLLGEMPHVLPQFPYPKASLAILRAFTAIVGCEIDLSELEEQARQIEQKLAEILERVEKTVEQAEAPPGTVLPFTEPDEPEEAEGDANNFGLRPRDHERIEDLFAEAARDRSRAYELKQELDRLKVFHEFEDRFLDLFQEPK
jgi:uncharacterized protein